MTENGSVENAVLDNTSLKDFRSTLGGTVARGRFDTLRTNVASTYPEVYSSPYHDYCQWVVSDTGNKTENAYKILRALMKAKVIEVKSLPKFFDAMDAILAAL
jgi:hypothetical protein